MVQYRTQHWPRYMGTRGDASRHTYQAWLAPHDSQDSGTQDVQFVTYSNHGRTHGGQQVPGPGVFIPPGRRGGDER